MSEGEIDGPTEPKLVPIFLQVSVRKLHKNLVSGADNGGIKEAGGEENNIIITDSTLRSLLPPQLINTIKIQGYVQS